jgi:hypothetical protein
MFIILRRYAGVAAQARAAGQDGSQADCPGVVRVRASQVARMRCPARCSVSPTRMAGEAESICRRSVPAPLA